MHPKRVLAAIFTVGGTENVLSSAVECVPEKGIIKRRRVFLEFFKNIQLVNVHTFRSFRWPLGGLGSSARIRDVFFGDLLIRGVYEFVLVFVDSTEG